VLGPIDAWLLLRGMRTLALRVERQNASALALAEFLQSHPAVTSVNYPGLSTHPQHALARSQMRGFGGVFSFEVDGGAERVERVIESLRIPSRAASIGGCESLVVAPAAMWAGTLDDEALAALGVSPSLIRFAVGIENVEDLRSDLDRALRV
jgi:cystathionine beta-lyase/cystathionine gamma-synthase